MKKKRNVLIFPGGNEIGLEIRKSLMFCKEVKIFSAASDVLNHAPYVYENHFIVPDISDSSWFDKLNKIILREKIDFVFPTNVFVIDVLSEKRNDLKCKVILPEVDTVKTCRSKSKTLDLVKDIIDVPQIFLSSDLVKSYPVYVKADNWFGEQKSYLANSKDELDKIIESDAKTKYLIQEYLSGSEYSIDCFSNKKGEVLFCGGRQRNRVRMGTSLNSSIVDDKLNYFFLETAKKIIGKTKIYGAWFFQMKADKHGNLKLLEIEPRIAGTMALNRVRGVNFPLLSLFLHSGIDNLKILLNDFDVTIDRSLHNRYNFTIDYEVVYIDLDDVIIFEDGRINTQALTFLYQCINQKKKIILISKSNHSDKISLLKSKKIHQIFDEIIWLKEEQSKADFIFPDKAIFIDDSFSQRNEVVKKHGIPTFDGSMLEMLLNEKS